MMATLQKITLTLVAVAAVALSAMGEQEYHFDFVPNANLPADAVELSPEHAVQPGEFYTERPSKKPEGVPATFVLVWVYQGQPGGVRFVGSAYMDADYVNELHIDYNLVTL